MATSEHPMTHDELVELERAVAAALASGDTSAITILGHGEISVALGWPAERPRLVCKRTPPFTRAELDAYRDTVTGYVDRLRASGLPVVDTSIMTVPRGRRWVAYLVQPLLAADTLGDKVLQAARPEADHPFLVALADAVARVTDRLSFDAQVTNLAWDGDALTLVDVGTPFVWSADGVLQFDMRPFTRMLPAPVRPLVVKELTSLVERWRSPRGVGLDIVANLYREGLDQWAPAVIEALNRRLDPPQPLTEAEARVLFDDDVKTWPRLKRLQAVERWYCTTVRRRPYEFFIRSTF